MTRSISLSQGKEALVNEEGGGMIAIPDPPNWPWKDRTEGPSLEAMSEFYQYLREIALERGILEEDANGRLRRRTEIREEV